MSNRWPAGIIRKTPVTPAGPFQNGAASGVWSLADAAYWTKQGLWPLAGNTLPAIEDVFSTYLYTGNDGTQTITNGIDLAGKGGLVWTKGRSNADVHILSNTVGPTGNLLQSQSTEPQYINPQAVSGFTASGFSIGAEGNLNGTGKTYASWTFRKAPKFFDVVTYTGNGVAGRQIAHNLGVAPGMIIVKGTGISSNWAVYHRSLGATEAAFLNTTDASSAFTYWNNTAPTSTEFSLGTSGTVNSSGQTYVAYLYAHDATSDGLIQCGSYVGSSSSGVTVNLGWEPQWVMIKNVTQTGPNWTILDVMRGMAQTSTLYLSPNTSGAESANQGGGVNPTATGFTISSAFGNPVNGDGQTHVYMAIRRGPMRTPTLGTSVFLPVTYTGTDTNGRSDVASVQNADVLLQMIRNANSNKAFVDRVRGFGSELSPRSTGAEGPGDYGITNIINDKIIQKNLGGWYTSFNSSSSNYVSLTFRRAPGFMDVVCYTGTGVLGRTVAHNLGVAPEMIIVKRRSAANDWGVYHSALGNTKLIYLNYNLTPYTAINWWNNTTPTASVFTVGDQNENNASGSTYVSYLFASCPGVSKVGSYTGNGSSQTINCAFTTGSRFVMIKRTDSTGDWYVWDSARGIVAGNDPHLSLNTIVSEVTTDDSVDTDSSGFVVNQDAATDVNVNGGTYIFLAIA